MKITREEKHLYKFLDVINKIFGRTTNKTYLIGSGNKLYFYTLGYCGVFISKDDEQQIINAYEFDHKEYQLKQLPNKEYVLDQCDYETDITLNIIHFIDNRCIDTIWQMEIYKDYSCKAAKIAVHTNKWMKDEDLTLLKAFDMYDIFTCGDGILFKHVNETSVINLILMDSVVAPDNDDVTQLKLEEIETSIIQARIYDVEIDEISSIAENSQTGIIEPVEENDAQNSSKEEIESTYDYDDPMA